MQLKQLLQVNRATVTVLYILKRHHGDTTGHKNVITYLKYGTTEYTDIANSCK